MKKRLLNKRSKIVQAKWTKLLVDSFYKQGPFSESPFYKRLKEKAGV